MKVLSFEKRNKMSLITLERDDGQQHNWILLDGQLEQYMEVYWLQPGEALELLALDIMDDSVEVPPYDAPGMREVVEQILSRAGDLEWMVDRDETLARITVANDVASELTEAWRERRKIEEAHRYGYQKRQEELLADEFMTVMPSALRAAPRDVTTSPALPSVGLGITFVP